MGGGKVSLVSEFSDQLLVDCFTIGAESRAELADMVKKIPAASVRG